MKRFRQNIFAKGLTKFFSFSLITATLFNCISSQTEVNVIDANLTATTVANLRDNVSFGTTTPSSQTSTILPTRSGILGTTTIIPSNSNENSTQGPRNKNASNIDTSTKGVKLENSTQNTNITTAPDAMNNTNGVLRNYSINLQLVPDGKLQLRMDVKEETVMFTVKINLTDWEFTQSNDSNKNDDYRTTGISLKTLLIGFETEDSSHNMFLDVVSIPLNGDDEKELHIIKVCCSEITDEIRRNWFYNVFCCKFLSEDSHWNKRDKVLIPDSSQNYELMSFDSGRDRTTFSVTFSRPWMTCDDNDIQFTNVPLKIWWLLDTFSQDPDFDKGKIPGTPKYANLEKEASTESTPISMTTTSVVTVFLNETEQTDENQNASAKNTGLSNTSELAVGKNITKEKSNPSSAKNVTLPRDVELLRFLKYQEFNGPFNVSFRELLSNFTFVIIKMCGNKESRSYTCSLSELEKRNFAHSHFSVTKGILPKSGISNKLSEKEAIFCPSDEILHGNATTVNALTSGKRQGKENAAITNLKPNPAQFLNTVVALFIVGHIL